MLGYVMSQARSNDASFRRHTAYGVINSAVVLPLLAAAHPIAAHACRADCPWLRVAFLCGFGRLGFAVCGLRAPIQGNWR